MAKDYLNYTGYLKDIPADKGVVKLLELGHELFNAVNKAYSSLTQNETLFWFVLCKPVVTVSLYQSQKWLAYFSLVSRYRISNS